MTGMFRLKSSPFEREQDEDKVSPRKIYFLSVEGNNTETEYFTELEKYREQLGIQADIHVEVLKRGKRDTQSSPNKVLELMEEYLSIRESTNEELIEERFQPINKIQSKYTKEFMRQYLENPQSISRKKRNQFEDLCRKIGCDLNYHKFLADYNSDEDVFCIVIDRDKERDNSDDEAVRFEKFIKECMDRKMQVFISNPCFEFWLLLHVCDVSKEYEGKSEEIRKNKIVHINENGEKEEWNLSREVSERNHHGKSKIKFSDNYLPHIVEAIQRSKKFVTDVESLQNEIGTNIGILIETMQKDDK